MRKLLLPLLLIVFAGYTATGQQIQITGEIIDKANQEAVPYVHIINQSTQQGTVSNTEGRFWVTMQKTDTLLFSAIGFEKYAFTLKPDVTSDKLIVTIGLNSSTLELAPVDVFAFRDEKALKKALLDIDLPIEEDNSIDLPGVRKAQRSYRPDEGGISLGSPLTSLAKVFSKEEKEKKKLKEYKKEYEYQKLITSKYNRTIVMEITQLPEDRVEDFMNFCVLEDSFIKRASEYELAVVLNQCLIDFEKLDTEQEKSNN